MRFWAFDPSESNSIHNYLSASSSTSAHNNDDDDVSVSYEELSIHSCSSVANYKNIDDVNVDVNNYPARMHGASLDTCSSVASFKMAAASRILHRYRTWKIRKEFLSKRQQAVEIPAVLRGYKVRIHYHKRKVIRRRSIDPTNGRFEARNKQKSGLRDICYKFRPYFAQKRRRSKNIGGQSWHMEKQKHRNEELRFIDIIAELEAELIGMEKLDRRSTHRTA